WLTVLRKTSPEGKRAAPLASRLESSLFLFEPGKDQLGKLRDIPGIIDAAVMGAIEPKPGTLERGVHPARADHVQASELLLEVNMTLEAVWNGNAMPSTVDTELVQVVRAPRAKDKRRAPYPIEKVVEYTPERLGAIDIRLANAGELLAERTELRLG